MPNETAKMLVPRIGTELSKLFSSSLLTSMPDAINNAVIITAPPAIKSGKVFINGVKPKFFNTKS